MNNHNGYISLRFMVVAVVFSLAFTACSKHPPKRAQVAIHTVNVRLANYVASVNQILAASDHPDADKLMGTGTRLVLVADALDRWATPPGEAARVHIDPTDLSQTLKTEIQMILAEGRIDDVLVALKLESEAHPQWTALEKAITDIETVIRTGKRMQASRRVTAEVVGVILGAALRGGY